MPTNRRRHSRGRRSQSAELGAMEKFALQFGPLGPGEQDTERLLDLWEVHGDAFLEEWIQEHPGTRPWAWWSFEADEPRREANPLRTGGVLADSGEEGRKRPGRVLIGGAAGDLVPWLEEERDYLARLCLLYPGEAEAIEALGDEDEPLALRRPAG